jgi:hypothetical protein
MLNIFLPWEPFIIQKYTQISTASFEIINAINVEFYKFLPSACVKTESRSYSQEGGFIHISKDFDDFIVTNRVELGLPIMILESQDIFFLL